MKRYAFGLLLVLCGSSAGCGDGETADDDAAVRNAMIDAGHQGAASNLPSSQADGGAALAPGLDGGQSAPSGATSLTGSLGTSGAIQPIVSSVVISNSGETLIYLTTAPLTCEQVKVSPWLRTFTSGAQVVEIVVKGPAKVGVAKDPEVNWAIGGKSDHSEQPAQTASVTFTKSEAMGVVEGTVMATYDKPTGNLSGSFHAEFCPDGQDY
ncbi:MAG: hypothetical protein JWN48_130 [Myxococcaceae bacterium]|nr:hypothetical protein [Myxococcaceae bacterium]